MQANDRFYTASTLNEVRQYQYRSFRVVWPESVTDCPECGYDEFTHSASNVGCKLCHGIGKVLTWVTAEYQARIQHYDFVTLAVSGLPPGVEIGDVVLYVNKDVMTMIENVQTSTYGYVFVDSDTYRPFSIAPTGVGHQDEWRVELKRTQMDIRAPGL